MKVYEARVSSRRVTMGEQAVVSGGSNADRIAPSFDREWRSMEHAYMVFKRGHQSIQVEVEEGGEYAIPPELLTERGFIDLSFYGTKGEAGEEGYELLNSEVLREAVYVAEGGPVNAPTAGGSSGGGSSDDDEEDYATDDEVREALGL